jgi:HPr kinase/phosphorylase
MMKDITIRDFFDNKKKDLALSLVTETGTLDNRITSPHVNRPGLALAGFTEVFASDRIQVFGETEVRYLQTIDEDTLYKRMKEFLVNSIPCIIVSKGLTLPPVIEYLANDLNVGILSSRLSTLNLMQMLSKYLQDYFAIEKTIHATLVEVFGLGVMLTGKSGIGKSECALDLVHRGHSLVCDDMINIRLIDDRLIGRPGGDFGYFMEIRGVGLINVEKMFGIERVRHQKTLDLQVELMPWQENMDYERIGLSENYVEHLGIKVPVIYLPVSPGKNVSVIVEVAAMNLILKNEGYDAAEDWNRKVQDEIKRKTKFNNIEQSVERDDKPGNNG